MRSPNLIQELIQYKLKKGEVPKYKDFWPIHWGKPPFQIKEKTDPSGILFHPSQPTEVVEINNEDNILKLFENGYRIYFDCGKYIGE